MNTARDPVRRFPDDDPEALRLLELLAQLAADPFPASALVEHSDVLPDGLAERVRDTGECDRMVAGLVDRGLLAVVGDDRWQLDDATRALLSEATDADAERRACKDALGLMRAAFPPRGDEFPLWAISEPLLTHAVAVADRAVELGLDGAAAGWLLERAAALRDEQGKTTLARALAERAVDAALDAGDTLVEGVARRTLGSVLAEHGDYADARAVLERAVQLHEALGERGRVEAARDRTALAFALLKQGRPDDALEAIDRAREVLNRDADADALVHALMMQGHVLVTVPDYAAARSAYGEAVELAERALDPRNQAILFALGGLGVVLHNLDEDIEAIAKLERALELGESTLGEDHPSTAVVRSHLSDALLGADRVDEARAHVERALRLGERTLAEDHPDLRIRHRKLAALAQRQGDLATAQEELGAALAIAERSPALRPTDILTDLVDLARIRDERGERSAIELYERALEIVNETSKNDEEVAVYRMLAGRSAQKLGELGIAAVQFRKALELLERFDGEDDGRGRLTCRVALAQIAYGLADQIADVQEALGEAERADDARAVAAAAYTAALERELTSDDVQVLGALAQIALGSGELDVVELALTKASPLAADDEQRRQVGVAWHALGRAQRARGALDTAERVYRAALPLLKHMPRIEGVVLHDLGDVRRSQDGWDEALDFYQRAVARKQASSPLRERDLAVSMNAMGLALIAVGRPLEAAQVAQEAATLVEGDADGHPPVRARSLGLAGRGLAVAGELDRALGLLEDSCRIFAEQGSPSAERAAAVGLRAAVKSRLGDEVAARGLLVRELDASDAEGALVIAEACREIGVLALCEIALERAEGLVLMGGPERAANVPARRVGHGWHRLGRARMEDEAYDDAWRSFARAMSLLSGKPYDHGVVLHDLADIRSEQGRLEEALALYRQAVDRKQADAEPDDRSDLTITLLELGRCLRQNDRFDEARAVFEDVLSRLLDLPERAPLEEGHALNGIGDVLAEQERWQQAIDYYRRALNRKQEADERDPRSEADTLLDLGRAFEANRDLEEALLAFEQRLETLIGLDERDAYMEAVTLHDIGDVRQTQGHLDAAADLYRQALDRKRGAPDSGDPEDIAVTLLAFGNVELKRKDVEAAEACANEAAELLRRTEVDDPEHRLLLVSAVVLAAKARTAAGDGSVALKLLEEADLLMERISELKPVEAARIKDLLAEACMTEGRDEAAEEARSQAQSLMGEEPPSPERSR